MPVLTKSHVANGRSPAVRICRADCLTCPALIRENQLVSNTTSRNYFAISSLQTSKLCLSSNVNTL